MPRIAFDTGAKYPTTTTTVNGSGFSGDWANPANIFADDGAGATAAFLAPPSSTFELNGGTFGMNVPPNAIIDGIKLEMEVLSSARWFEAQSSMFLKKAGVSAGSNKAGLGSAANGVWTYGGATDLWGTTWTPSQINNAGFGFGFSAAYTSSGNDFNISIDYVRITVYWHYSVDVSPADVPKRHLYKVFNKGVFMGKLPNVTSKFGYPLEINSVGASIQIECGVSADTASEPGGRLLTEDGDYITTEDGDYIYTEGQPPILGAGNSLDPVLIQNGNRIEVWEYSYYYPNGKLMFKGQVNRIEAGFGDPSDNKLKLTVYSDGADTDDYIARGAPFNYTLDQSQGINGLYTLITQSDKGAMWNRYGQTWIPGAGVSNLGAIDLGLNGNCDVTVTVYAGLNGTIMGQVTKSIATNGGYAVIRFGFPTLIPVTAGQSYFFTVAVGAGQQCYIHYNPENYANGSMYNSNYSGGSGGGAYTSVDGYDLNFWTYYGANTTSATYTLKDPSTEMLKPIIDDYQLRGGLIGYNSSSIDATGLALTVSFNTETILDALKKILTVAPSGFYFYVDPGTDTLYFKRTATTPTYKLIKGRHLNKVDLVMSIENVKNDLLFSGATIAGTNLFTEYTDLTSKANYGQRLARQSDNRTGLQPTADAIGTSFISENKDEYYETTVTVLDRTMDITLFKPGQTIGLRGFGTFIDSIMLQIVRVEYTPGGYAANLTLGNLPKRFSDEFDKIIRGLTAEQTVANPSAPS